VPVLARILEAHGLSTVIVTQMPYWAEKIGVPRALGVEFSFAQTLGKPHDAAFQTGVIRQALEVLETASGPGTVIHSPIKWPESDADALAGWQPDQPSPIVKELAPDIRSLIRQKRASRR
jgi:hypothetical protein